VDVPITRVGGADPAVPLPAYAHPGDAGCDLRARVDGSIRPGERLAVPTGVAVAIPDGWAGLVLPRSGLARRHGVTLVNTPGLIDAGYRGEIELLMVNLDPVTPFAFSAGDRVAQLVFVPFAAVNWREVAELPPSVRGEGGFGSSGTG
jgi:dUTP pyrophosphatase